MDNQGGRMLIVLDGGPCNQVLPTDPIIGCRTFTQSGPNLPKHDGYIIGHMSERDAYFKAFKKLFDATLAPTPVNRTSTITSTK